MTGKSLSRARDILGIGATACVAFVLTFALVGCESQPKVVGDNSSSAEATQPQEEEPSTENLAVGSQVEMGDGLTVSVDSIETGLQNYDGSAIICARVTYTNNGEKQADFNQFDWKGEDANGAQESSTYYSDATDDLGSGSLAPGGTKSGNLYFEGDVTKLLYFGNMFLNDEPQASWTVE